MTGLNNVSAKLFVIGDVELSFVVKESVVFFPFEDTRDKSLRAFLSQSVERSGYFCFAFRRFFNTSFDVGGFRFSESSGCDRAEVFGL